MLAEQRQFHGFGPNGRTHFDSFPVDESRTVSWNDDYAEVTMGSDFTQDRPFSPPPPATSTRVQARAEKEAAAEEFVAAYTGLEELVAEYAAAVGEQKAQLMKQGIPPSKAVTPQGQLVILPYLMPLLAARTALLAAATEQLRAVTS